MTEKFGKGVSYLRDISTYAQENVNQDKIKKMLEIIKKVKGYFDEHEINK